VECEKESEGVGQCMCMRCDWPDWPIKIWDRSVGVLIKIKLTVNSKLKI
jgi:hypothetical protein